MVKPCNIFKTKMLIKVFTLMFVFCFSISWGQVVYFHDFGTTTISTSPYTVTPTTINSNLSSSQWTSSTGTFTNFAGNGGAPSQALSLNNSSGTPSLTLTFSVAAGCTLDITSFNFWRQRSTSGAQTWTLTINGIVVGNGSIPTTGAFIGNTAVANAVNGLTGVVSVVFSVSGASGTGTFRLDDFTLNGSTTCGASNTITTGGVSNPPFALTDCTVTASGNVTFTSTGTFSVGNTYTAQLSNASGSFATPVNIGTITSTANSGTISVTIPGGTASGTGYMIRIVSDNPVVIGSNSAAFTITTSCTPTITPGGTITACAFTGAMSIFDKCNNGQGCTSGCDLTAYANLGYTMCDGSANNSNCFGAANPGGQQLQGVVFNIPSGCTMSVTVEFKTRGGACSNSGMDNGDYLIIGSTTYTGTGNANITQSITQTGGSIFIEQSANRSDEILTFTASIISGSCLQCSLLEVTLLSFNCISESDGYKLVWATANEHQSKNFEIEYSVDGVNFLKISEMPAKGESNSYLYYENYVQNIFSSPLVYFRLRMNDLNGGFRYSPIVYVQNDFLNSLSVSPNPSVNSDIVVYVGSKLNYLNSTISIYDVNGKILVDEVIKESQTKINTQSFTDGIYFLRVSSPYKTENFKLIIQK